MNNEKARAFIINESLGMEPVTPTIVSENKKINRVSIETVLQDADVVNRNKRLYEKDAINYGLETPYVQERIRTKSWYGEAGKRDCPLL